MSKHQWKEGFVKLPYNGRSLDKAKKELKTLIDQFRQSNTDGDSLSASPNVWEGATGMMEHLKLTFPMPQKVSMLGDSHIQVICPTGRNIAKKDNVSLQLDHNGPDCISTRRAHHIAAEQQSKLSLVPVSDEAKPLNISNVSGFTSPQATDPFLQALSSTSELVELINDDGNNSDFNKVSMSFPVAQDSQHKFATATGDFNHNFPRNILSPKHQPLIDLVSGEDSSKASTLYMTKVKEWKKVMKDIQNISDDLQDSSFTLKYQMCAQDQETVCISWRRACFLMECLYADMEIERMALKPDTKKKLFSFPINIKKKIGKSRASKISKKFSSIKSALYLIQSIFRKLRSANKKLFRAYNKNVKSNELAIKAPILLSMNKNRYLQYLQGKPLPLQMTPGLSAGLYGKDESVHDRYIKWLEHIG